MKRTLMSLLVLAGVAAPAAAQDTIRYLDRSTKKEATASGTITDESPSRIAYRLGTGPKEVPAADVYEVNYQLPFGRGGQEYRRADNLEKSLEKATTPEQRRKVLADAVKEYQAAQSVMAKFNESKFAQRHVQFKIARLTARLAEEDPAQEMAAAELLAKFLKDHPESWQLAQATEALADLQMKRKDYEGSRKTYEALAKSPNISRELRREAELNVARTLTRAKNYKEAEALLQAALKTLPADDPQAGKVKVLLTECLAASGKVAEAMKQLQAIIDAAADPELKAMAYNGLGDCYLASNRQKDALYSYLWVDVIYNQDRDEHVRAMENLAKLFETGPLKDEGRAKQYRERLLKR